MKKCRFCAGLLCLFVFIVLLVSRSRPQIDRAKFEPVYRSAKGVEVSIIQVGLNYARMGELIQGFATEISIAEDRTETNAERLLVARYDEALTIPRDSATLWKDQIELSKFEWLKGYLPCEVGEIEIIADKYRLQKEEEDLAKIGPKQWFIRSDSIQTLWTLAEAKIQERKQDL